VVASVAHFKGNIMSEKTQIHKNVMEILVVEEIERQLANYPATITRFINTVEVATFALNRLPPLYASCEEGLRKQQLRGCNELQPKISTAVRQALAAVQRDPLRFSTPLLQEDSRESQKALQALRELLPHREISWRNVANVIQQAIAKQTWKENRFKTPREPANLELQYWSDDRYIR
jgi:Late competence development protein ComFB